MSSPPSARITAPWTPEQVETLNRWQHAGIVHEFTCRNDDHRPRPMLVATVDGWVCPECTRTQDWAFDYMADSQMLDDMLERRRRFLAGEPQEPIK